jgi:hypothetical protein
MRFESHIAILVQHEKLRPGVRVLDFAIEPEIVIVTSKILGDNVHRVRSPPTRHPTALDCVDAVIIELGATVAGLSRDADRQII